MVTGGIDNLTPFIPRTFRGVPQERGNWNKKRGSAPLRYPGGVGETKG